MRPRLTMTLIALVGTTAFGAVAASPSPVAVQESDANTPATDVEDGERIYRASCAMCHGADASGMMGMHPSLRGAIARLSREGVEVTIRQGRQTQPPMPAFEGRLTSDEVDDVVAYIASLPEGPRNFGPGMDDGMTGGTGMMGDGMDMGDTATVVLVVLAGLSVAAGVVTISRRNGSARRMLDRRYAAGELSREDYLQRRRDLHGE